MPAAKSLRDDFGRAVRELREEAGISQEDLALRAGLSRSYFSRVERAVRNMGLENIGKLADALGIPPSAIFLRAEEKRR